MFPMGMPPKTKQKNRDSGVPTKVVFRWEHDLGWLWMTLVEVKEEEVKEEVEEEEDVKEKLEWLGITCNMHHHSTCSK